MAQKATTLESIVGQARVIGILTGMLRNDRLAHALLFTGADGVGRQTTAKALAMALNCLHPVGLSACQACPSCRKVASGNHPDLIVVKPSGAFIKIDQVRGLRKDLRFAPLEGRRRVIIINDGQAMKAEASNALLKMLEEPPNDTHIIVTAPETTDLLPTIVSRCQHLAFRPIAPAEIAEVLVTRKGLDRHGATTLSLLAGGSLGRALAADAEQWMTWRRDLLERVHAMSDVTKPTAALFDFAQTLARDKDRLDDALGMMTMWFRDCLVCKFVPEKVLNKDFLKEIKALSAEHSVDELLGKMSATVAAQAAIWKNVNARLALDVMMMRLRSGPLSSLGPAMHRV
ncbi:MAG: DNA polymerase III subunit delta' [Thermodesulfobacteriota bacterium]|nr:DNA polymerase III subunit delta' [Thermodesulfobacteriota bacterium]